MLIGISLALTQQRNRLGSAPVDPLAGFNWAARLQTHIPGSNTPLGLYQDVACTIPCTMDGDPVAAWRDELSVSGVIAIQVLPQKQPILAFQSGVPTILYDGVDDYLLTTATPTCGTMFTGAALAAVDANYHVVAYIGSGGSGYVIVYQSGGGFYLANNAFDAHWANGVSGYPSGDDTDWYLFSGTSSSPTTGEITIGILFSLAAFAFNGSMTSLLFAPTAFADADRQTCETYLESLNP